jgi:hypothetical protein
VAVDTDVDLSEVDAFADELATLGGSLRWA